jgi:hypothetical protein
MNKFRIAYRDVYNLYGNQKPKSINTIKSPPDTWLWYIHFSMSLSRFKSKNAFYESSTTM